MISLFKRLTSCRKGQHTRDSLRVRHDGHQWVGYCRHCGADLRKNHLGTWVEK